MVIYHNLSHLQTKEVGWRCWIGSRYQTLTTSQWARFGKVNVKWPKIFISSQYVFISVLKTHNIYFYYRAGQKVSPNALFFRFYRIVHQAAKQRLVINFVTHCWHPDERHAAPRWTTIPPWKKNSDDTKVILQRDRLQNVPYEAKYEILSDFVFNIHKHHVIQETNCLLHYHWHLVTM